MKRRILKWTLSIILIIFLPFIMLGLRFYWQRVKPTHENELRMAILESIQIPYPNVDTIIIDTDWRICGNSSPFETPAIFDSQIESENNLNYLRKKMNKVIYKSEDYSNYLNTVNYIPDLWTEYTKNKIDGNIKTEEINLWNIKTYENYRFDKETIFIEKNFAYENDKWNFEIVNQAKRKYGVQQ